MRILLTVSLLVCLIGRSSAQVTVTREGFGFDLSRPFFVGGWHAGGRVNTGKPQTDSAQVFDLSSLYFEQSYPGFWLEDSTGKAGASFNAAHELQTDLAFFGAGDLDTQITFFSTAKSGGKTTLLYHGFYDQQGGSILPSRPLPLLQFPMQVGDTWSNSDTGVVNGHERTISISAIVDGFGTLLLPTGIYPCIRVLAVFDFADYIQYRYYYLTNQPNTYACLISLKKPDSSTEYQSINRAFYTSSAAKYDHFVSPIIIFTNMGRTAESVVGNSDTVWPIISNLGDTTAVIDSISVTMNPVYFLGSDLHGVKVRAHDSIMIPIVFRPTKSGIVNALLFVKSGGFSQTLSVSGRGITSNAVAQEALEADTISDFPNQVFDQMSLPENVNRSHLMLTDIAGRIQEINLNPQGLDVSRLVPGTYFLTDGKMVHRFTKMTKR